MGTRSVAIRISGRRRGGGRARRRKTADLSSGGGGVDVGIAAAAFTLHLRIAAPALSPGAAAAMRRGTGIVGI